MLFPRLHFWDAIRWCLIIYFTYAATLFWHLHCLCHIAMRKLLFLLPYIAFRLIAGFAMEEYVPFRCHAIRSCCLKHEHRFLKEPAEERRDEIDWTYFTILQTYCWMRDQTGYYLHDHPLYYLSLLCFTYCLIWKRDEMMFPPCSRLMNIKMTRLYFHSWGKMKRELKMRLRQRGLQKSADKTYTCPLWKIKKRDDMRCSAIWCIFTLVFMTR